MLTLILVSVFSVLAEAAGEGFTMVVLVSFFSVFSKGGLVTVVSFCSQAANSAMLASRPMYFFIQMDRSRLRIEPSLRSRRWRRLRGTRSHGRFGRGCWACCRGGGFSFLFTSREQGGTSQNADIFVHKFESRMGYSVIS